MAQKTVYYMRSIGIYDFEMLVIPQNKARYAGGVARLVKLSGTGGDFGTRRGGTIFPPLMICPTAI